ncbi:3-methyladenine DNA glycosylase [Bacillus sp. SCS-153A]
MSKEHEEKGNLSLEQEEKKENDQEIDPQRDPEKPKHPED